MATEPEFLVAKLKVLVTCAMVWLTISSPEHAKPWEENSDKDSEKSNGLETTDRCPCGIC